MRQVEIIRVWDKVGQSYRVHVPSLCYTWNAEGDRRLTHRPETTSHRHTGRLHRAESLVSTSFIEGAQPARLDCDWLHRILLKVHVDAMLAQPFWQ